MDCQSQLLYISAQHQSPPPQDCVLSPLLYSHRFPKTVLQEIMRTKYADNTTITGHIEISFVSPPHLFTSNFLYSRFL